MGNQVAHGFHAIRDVFPEPLSEHVDEVNDAIVANLVEHNRQVDAMVGLFVEKTAEHQARFETVTRRRLQAADEHARAVMGKGQVTSTLAWPLQKGMDADGETYAAAEEMTVQQASNRMYALNLSDLDWIATHIVSALVGNANWTWVDDKYGNLTIKPLANGDTQVYQVKTGAQDGQTDDHYMAQADAISDTANPYGTIASELKEHPENGGVPICLIPEGLKTTTMNLSNFYTPWDKDFEIGTGNTILQAQLGVEVPGEVLGKVYDGPWIVQWDRVPTSYILGVMSGGIKPLRMRENENPNLRGFRRVATVDMYPFRKSEWLRQAGLGAWNRVGACVYQIGEASYSTPTGYQGPIG